MYAEMKHRFSTQRLQFAPMQEADPAAVVEAIDDLRVSRFLANVPSSYTYADAVDFIESAAPEPGKGWSIYDETGLVGAVALAEGALGYWLRHSAWGKGYMTEAGDALVDQYFEDPANQVIAANYALENAASGNVLSKLGFEKHDVQDVYYPAKQRSFLSQTVRLTRDRWQSCRSFRLETDRLILRESRDADWQDLQRIAGNSTVAPMLGSVENPWPDTNVRSWLRKGQFRGRPGFRGIIQLKNGPVIGMVGMGKAPGPGPMTCAYFLDQDHWGKGIVTEAMGAFLTHFLDRFDLDEIEADHFLDNPASGRVLVKLGFEQYGQGIAKSAARVEAAPVTLYRLKRHDLKVTS